MTKTIGSFDLASLKNLRDDVTQYFWFESDSSSAWGGGAHVTLYPESQFTDSTSPNYMKGQNIIMNTDGFSIRNGGLPMMVLDNDSLDFNAVDTSLGTYTTMATFGLTGATIGQTNGAHSVIDADGQRFYGGSDGTTQLANIGYGETAGASGVINSPFYTFGLRGGSTALDYDSTATYSFGALCVYNDVLYICVEDITTPEAWDSTKWQRAIGGYSLVEGYNAVASGMYSHAEGYATIATRFYAHAEGYQSKAIAEYSHAEGDGSEASGFASHAEGLHTIASGFRAHAEGEGSEASGSDSHAEGYKSEASGAFSHTEGYKSKANGYYSHAQNNYTIASKRAQTALGAYNDEDTSTTTTHPSGDAFYGQYAVIVGNGTDDNARSNALTVDWVGNVEATGEIHGVLSSPTISISSSTGSLNNYEIYRQGNVVQLWISVRKTTATATANNIYVGAINTTSLRPKMFTTSGTYYGSYAINGSISTTGTITIRNSDSRQVAAMTSDLSISFTYLVD